MDTVLDVLGYQVDYSSAWKAVELALAQKESWTRAELLDLLTTTEVRFLRVKK